MSQIQNNKENLVRTASSTVSSVRGDGLLRAISRHGECKYSINPSQLPKLIH